MFDHNMGLSRVCTVRTGLHEEELTVFCFYNEDVKLIIQEAIINSTTSGIPAGP